ncbi:MAG: hypothetical protein AB1746_05925 [Candidatus Zixiibacteriota bacterium]
MKRNRMTYMLISALLLLPLLIILQSAAVGQERGETIKKGNFSLKRSEPPQFLVTGVALDKLSKARFENMALVNQGLAGQFGRTYSLFNENDSSQASVSAAVYENPAAAEDAVLELLNSTSAVFKPGTKSGAVIGTHSWYLESRNGSGTVVFTHDNALFQVFSSDYDLAENKARDIDEDLSRGTNGIRLGTKVILPEVTNVKMPGDLSVKKQSRLNIEGRDPQSMKVMYSVSARGGQVITTDKHDEVIFIPGAEGESELIIYMVNDESVVSPAFIKKMTVGRENK